MINIGGMGLSAGQGEPGKVPRTLRILVADDDGDTVLTLMMVLRSEGHQVKGVHRGTEVLAGIREFEPDAVLADINMPGLTGYEIARKVRADKYSRKPLLIGISGVYTQGSDRVLAELVGFDHYLTKPYAPSDLLRLLAPLRLPR
jgi:CheY-like chemotaxis protein